MTQLTGCFIDVNIALFAGLADWTTRLQISKTIFKRHVRQLQCLLDAEQWHVQRIIILAFLETLIVYLCARETLAIQQLY